MNASQSHDVSVLKIKKNFIGNWKESSLKVDKEREGGHSAFLMLNFNSKINQLIVEIINSQQFT